MAGMAGRANLAEKGLVSVDHVADTIMNPYLVSTCCRYIEAVPFSDL